MNASELKAILLLLLQQIDDLRVNQDVLAAASIGPQSLGALLDVRRAAETKTRDEFARLREQIEGLS